MHILQFASLSGEKKPTSQLWHPSRFFEFGHGLKAGVLVFALLMVTLATCRWWRGSVGTPVDAALAFRKIINQMVSKTKDGTVNYGRELIEAVIDGICIRYDIMHNQAKFSHIWPGWAIHMDQEIATTVALFAMPKCDEEMHPLQSRLMSISNLEKWKHLFLRFNKYLPQNQPLARCKQTQNRLTKHVNFLE